MRALREVLTIAGLLTLIGSVCLHWPQLPARIPTHYGLSGAPDAFGPRGTVWILAGAAIFLYALLTFVERNPHRMNLPAWVTPEQRAQVLPSALATLGWLKAEVMWIFAWMAWTTVGVALGFSTGLGAGFLPVSLLIVGLTLAGLMRNLARLKRQRV